MTTEEKAQKIAQYHCYNELSLLQSYNSAMDMAEWKDKQQKKNMLKFMKWIEKRGFIKEDLCYDTEHQVDTFINQILPKL